MSVFVFFFVIFDLAVVDEGGGEVFDSFHVAFRLHEAVEVGSGHFWTWDVDEEVFVDFDDLGVFFDALDTVGCVLFGIEGNSWRDEFEEVVNDVKVDVSILQGTDDDG